METSEYLQNADFPCFAFTSTIRNSHGFSPYTVYPGRQAAPFVEEVCHLARRLDLILEWGGSCTTYYEVACHLSEICGSTGPGPLCPLHRVTVEGCDVMGRPWMLALASNHQIPQGSDYAWSS